MTDVLIRGLSKETVARIDRKAEELGIPRNEYLRRRLEGDAHRPAMQVTAESWKLSAEVLADRGQHRAPSIPDLLTAATAEKAGLTVLAVDKDFDLIAEITGQPVETLALI